MSPAFLARAPRVPPRAARAGALGLLVLSIVAASGARADSVQVVSSRDNTLYENTSGSLSNGAGDGMFAGRTAQSTGSRRRALVRFDVASAVPAGSTIQSASLTLFCNAAAPSAQSVELHRVLQDWGEGTSNAGDPGGSGAPSAPGDATWKHTFYPAALWANLGGEFAGALSGSASVALGGFVTWASTPAMVADAQSWLDAPAGNFGWLLLGNEAVGATAARFETREAADAGVPVLSITYQPPSTPAQAASWGGVKGTYR